MAERERARALPQYVRAQRERESVFDSGRVHRIEIWNEHKNKTWDKTAFPKLFGTTFSFDEQQTGPSLHSVHRHRSDHIASQSDIDQNRTV